MDDLMAQLESMVFNLIFNFFSHNLSPFCVS